MSNLLSELATPNLALIAEGLHEALEAARLGSGVFKKAIDLSRWLFFYRSHKIVLNKSVDNIFTVLPELNKKLRIENGKLATSLNNLGSLELRNLIGIIFTEGVNLNENSEIKIPEISDEGLFIFQIFLPCWLHYFKTPTKFFRESRLGNLDALGKLLQIDKTVIADQRIARHIAKHGTKPQSPEYKLLVRALGGTPKKLPASRMKTFLAAFVYALAKQTGEPRSYRQIHALFDQSAQERGLGLVDPDLRMSPEAFAKAVRRNLVIWSNLPTGQN